MLLGKQKQIAVPPTRETFPGAAVGAFFWTSSVVKSLHHRDVAVKTVQAVKTP